MRRRTSAGLAIALLLVGLWLLARSSWVTAALFLVDSADVPQLSSLSRWTAAEVATRDLLVETRYGPIPARLYQPGGEGTHRAVVLVHGLHKDGIAETRLGPFARAMAERRFLVLTPQMEELQRYQITSVTTNKIEDAVDWFSAQEDLVSRGKVGIVGISYSGGLSIVAAGRSSVRDRVSFVVSVGGHGDVYRATRFLCTGILPDGRNIRPHDYGVGVLLLNLIPRLVPATQVGPVDAVLRLYLREEFEQGRQRIAEVPPPGGDILRSVEARDLDKVGPLMLPELEEFASDSALSPERSPAPAAPVFLLHGSEDTIVPPTESEALARHLSSKTEVHTLVTPLLTHVELQSGKALAEIWKIVKFWRLILRAAGS